MTTSAITKSGPGKDFDPDHYRMSIGDHLEELRLRLILGLLGFVVAAVVCMIMKDPVMRFFLRPLMIAQAHNKLPPQISFSEMSESFTVYIEVSLIVAAAFASPWLLYQVWQFVASGLYPRERKYITKYLPLSITLLVTGMFFVYVMVLPMMIEFFLAFDYGPAFTVAPADTDPIASTQPAVIVPFLHGNPLNPANGQIWVDMTQDRMKLNYNGDIRSIPFGMEGLVNPVIMLSQYIDMVVKLLLSFGLAFQLPLVVLALVRIGILDVEQLKGMRRIVYFAMCVIAAFIVPDVMTGMVALMIPLILLFEMGLWLAKRTPAADEAAE